VKFTSTADGETTTALRMLRVEHAFHRFSKPTISVICEVIRSSPQLQSLEVNVVKLHHATELAKVAAHHGGVTRLNFPAVEEEEIQFEDQQYLVCYQPATRLVQSLTPKLRYGESLLITPQHHRCLRELSLTVHITKLDQFNQILSQLPLRQLHLYINTAGANSGEELGVELAVLASVVQLSVDITGISAVREVILIFTNGPPAGLEVLRLGHTPASESERQWRLYLPPGQQLPSSIEFCYPYYQGNIGTTAVLHNLIGLNSGDC